MKAEDENPIEGVIEYAFDYKLAQIFFAERYNCF
jgi:hypothetical protein